ncbi:SRPBCC domain-containing protein [Flavobacterium sp.]|uniref:SRPBCC family protein n=1 Tax=Flavobacterium sp. TaxID=239 RepID=UPI00286D4DBD|nr:SRPBCC domain-containing protein [Flavobacterium sp.]
MNSNVIQLERLFDAPVATIWKALTDKTEMKKWYFDLEEFKAEVGFKFSFTGGPSPEKQYVHLCEVTEVIPQQKLTYSWAYEGYAGISHVTFELSSQENKTLLKLKHTGIDTFPQSQPDFAIFNFNAGWNGILNKSLEAYVESINQ